MKTARFIVEGNIQTKARPRATIIAGHATIYTPKDTLYYENYVKSCFKEQCPNINFGDAPMKVTIKFNFLPNKELATLCEKTGTDITEIECTNHKDVDNLAKIILDGLNGVAFKDDKNIIKLKVSKHYSIEPYEFVIVEIEERYTITIEQLKTKKTIQTLQTKIDTINAKEKKTKADITKLEKYQNEIKELKDGKCENDQ